MGNFHDTLQQATNDPFDLAPLLYFASEHTNKDKFPELSQKLEALRSAFENREITPAWIAEVHQNLQVFDQLLQGARINGQQMSDTQINIAAISFDPKYALAKNIYASWDRSVTTELRKDVEKAHTCEELDVILNSILEAAREEPLKSRISAETQNLFHDITSVQSDLHKKPDYKITDSQRVEHTGHITTADTSAEIRGHIQKVCDLLDSDFAAGVQFEKKYIASRQTYINSRDSIPTLKGTSLEDAGAVSAYIEEQKKSIETIRDVYQKMQKEKGVHINSTEYKNMRDAVKAVCEAKYDPNDRDSVAQMREKLEKVNATAAKYVQEKAMDKMKKTSRGIERKNTALLLMDATDPRSLDPIESHIIDKRLKKKDTPEKVPTSLKDLIEAERIANKSSEVAKPVRHGGYTTSTRVKTEKVPGGMKK